MITALDPKLVTYVLPEELPLDEAVMTRRMKRVLFLCVVSAWVGIFLVLRYDAYAVLYFLLGDDRFEPQLGSGAVGLLAIAVAIFLFYSKDKYRQKLLHFYQEVPQGKVLSRDISNGNYTVLIEGNNRLNKPRTYTVSVNAGDWYDGVYAKDKYVQIPKTSTD